MDSVRIEDFQPHEARALVEMWRASFEHGVGIRDPHPIEQQIEFLFGNVVPAFRVRVARRGGDIVGFLASNPESISQLFVRVADIGQGIGSRLLDIAKDESSGRLWLYTFARNTHARRFYERHGFRAIEFGFEPTWQLDDVKYLWVKGEGAA
ncbi:MAG: N-acetyltransferase family protein [Gemmatimonadota bacterium]